MTTIKKHSDREENVNFLKIFDQFWKSRIQIFLITSLFALASVTYALMKPNVYTSTTKLISAKVENDGGMSSLAAKYGGLASMAGINLGSSETSNKIMHAIELVNSWPFIEMVVSKNNLKPLLMAVKEWNEETGELVYDESLYNLESKTWISEGAERVEPTSFETYEYVVEEAMNIGFDEATGILFISFSHLSPKIADELTKIFTLEINEYFRTRDQQEASASIQFIKNKINTTSNTRLLEVFYNMIESHTQTIMFTEIKNEYLIKTLVPSKISEKRSSPNRALICIFGTLFGFTLCIFTIVVKVFMSEMKT